MTFKNRRVVTAGINVNSNNNQVVHNTLRDWDTTATDKSAISISGSYNTVENNNLNGTIAPCSGIYVLTGSSNIIRQNIIMTTGGDNAIYVASGVASTLIELNTIDVNYYNRINVHASATNTLVRWNSGYRTEYSASASNATATTWTFTPALANGWGSDGVPVRVYYSFNDTVTGAYWSFSGTTITITGTFTAAAVTCYVEAYSWNCP